MKLTEDDLDDRGRVTMLNLERMLTTVDKVAEHQTNNDARLVPVEKAAWFPMAACFGVDGDWFNIPNVARSSQRKHMTVELSTCDRCAVRTLCLDHALEFGEDVGIWGGLLPWERRKLRRAGGI